MKKSVKYFLMFAIISMLFSYGIFESHVSAASGQESQATSGYVIDSYHIDMVVNEDNTLEIREKIGAYFQVEKHGIYRNIPLENTVTRVDGTTSRNKAKVSGITVDSPFSVSTSNGYRVIKIGSPDSTLTGAKEYNLGYTYNLGKDRGKGYDELYFNLIGSEWDTSIGTITFSITMPKSFDASKLGFSSGVSGSTDSSKVTYNVHGNVITGSYHGTLNAGEALTVRLELPDGYFVNANNPFDFMTILSFIIPALSVVITMIVWFLYGRDRKVIETVEFYPPDGFNSAEVGFLYRGRARTKDVISLLIYLAEKGYLKISELESSSFLSKSVEFQLTKLKDYSEENENERIFLNGLFAFPHSTVVTSKDLKNKFYTTLNRILGNLNAKENRLKIYDKKSLQILLVIIGMIIINAVLITIKPVAEYSDGFTAMFSLGFLSVGMVSFLLMLFGKQPAYAKVTGVFFGAVFIVIPWMGMILPALLDDPVYLTANLAGSAWIIILLIFLKIMPKRTTYGNEMLGKIRGFKTFLETAEKPKLETLVMENPDYFYNILPYTYVLGVSDKWIKKFESIAVVMPDWYESSQPFNMVTFGVFMHATMASAATTMASNPSSGSGAGGGFSGGGFSGGGSGGGGGGSW